MIKLLINVLTIMLSFSVIKISSIAATPLDKVAQECITVEFNNQTHHKLREIISDYLLESDSAQYNDPISPSSITISFFDIDDDGVDEVFIYIRHSGYCGSAGCTFLILKPKIKAPTSINDFNLIPFVEPLKNIEGITAYNNIKILKDKTKGYNDILILHRGSPMNSVSAELVYKKYKWQGEYYDIADIYPASDY